MSNVPTNLIPTKITGLPEYGGTSTLGYMPYIIDGRTYKVQFANIAAVGAVPSTRTIATGNGLEGGGDLSQDRTISIISHGVGYAQLDFTGVVAGTYGGADTIPAITVDASGRITGAVNTPVVLSGYVPTSRTVTAGAGLMGGGQLNNNITVSLDPSNATPLSLGAASAGFGVQAAREDHVHPAVNLTDTTQTQGVLPLGRGGTGDALSPVVGAVIYADADSLNQTIAGNAGQVLMSAGGLGAPYWNTVTGTGTVSSVNVSGGTTGLTTSGGPITAAGTITIGGTLAVASGGTGATNATDARTNLSAAKSGANSDITSMSGITGSISTIDSVTFDITTDTVPAAGQTGWSLDFGTTVRGLGNGADILDGMDMVVYAANDEATTLTRGTVVYIDGSTGSRATVKRAINTSDATSAMTIGFVKDPIAVGASGYVVTQGVVDKLDTSAFASGDTIYLGATAGVYTNVKPYAPNHIVILGVVERSNAGNGQIYVKVNNGWEMDELHNVSAQSATNGQTLIYNQTTSLWEAHTLTAGTNISIANAAGSITINATDQYVGTVTSVDGSGGTTGLTLTGGPITTSGTLTLGGTLGVANGGTGATTASAARTNLGATTVGGNFFTLTNPSTITFPRINADNSVSTLDAATFRTAIGAGTGSGTVTSVDVSGGTTGLTTSGGPITGSGTITLGGTLAVANGGTGTGTAFTAGSVVFAGASGVYSQDNANLFWDDTNNRLGIGTSSPGYRLDLTADDTTANLGYAMRLRHNTTANGATIQFTDNPATTQYATIVSNTSEFSIRSGSTRPVTVWANGSERMRISSTGGVSIGNTTDPGAGNLYTNGRASSASLGVGTGVSALSAAIDVRGGGSAYFSSTAAGTYPTDGGSIGGGGTGLNLSSTGALPISFWTGDYSNERMRIDSSGNVGIGITAPSATGKFVVSGGYAATAYSSVGLLTPGAAQGERSDIALYSTFIGTADNGPRRTADIIAGFSTSTWGTEYLSFSVGNNGSSNDSKLVTSEKVRVTSAGNVGIGSTLPGATGFTSFLALGNNNAGIGNLGANIIGIATNNAECMRIDASGNVGIGTSSPSSFGKLAVAGNASAYNYVISDQGTAVAGTYGFTNGNGPSVITWGSATVNAGALDLTTAGTSRLLISTTGAITSSDLADAVGYKGLPQNSKTASYTLALSDMGKHISITTGGVVIPANSSVAFPVGATIVIYNDSGSTQALTITTDTLRQAGTTNTGARTIAVYGLVTCVKVASTTWVVTGNVS